jgi:hypothetical protein
LKQVDRLIGVLNVLGVLGVFGVLSVLGVLCMYNVPGFDSIGYKSALFLFTISVAVFTISEAVAGSRQIRSATIRYTLLLIGELHKEEFILRT